MIPRYSRPEMSAVWTEENKFGAYLKVEIEAAAAWSQLGVIPAEDVEKLRTKATFDVQRIYEIEKETRHDQRLPHQASQQHPAQGSPAVHRDSQETRIRVQGHALHRTHARRARRHHRPRAEVGVVVRGDAPQHRTFRDGRRRCGVRQNQRCRGQLRQHPAVRAGLRLRAIRHPFRPHLHAGAATRPPRPLHGHSRAHRFHHGADGHRGAPLATHGTPRG